MTDNVCFRLLDEPVVQGRGEDPAIVELSFARLLEEVAAVAGVLTAVGVVVGERVLLDLADDLDAVTVALAAARVGAVVVEAPEDVVRLSTLLEATTPVVVVTDRPERARAAFDGGAPRPGTLLLRGGEGPLDERRELDWDVALRAGRTDPAACVTVPVGAAHALTWTGASPVIRTVAEQVARGPATSPDPAAWRAVLLGG